MKEDSADPLPGGLIHKKGVASVRLRLGAH